ncbi:hypothetical protein [Nonomuraea sp. NPDC049129]|uniref:hypothetical protein n=1 Tax=Nonomuraea sp. NPDC049129 TaxID=3155272 RepID=UPI0034049CFD
MPEFEPLREEELVQVGVYRLIGRLSPDVFVGTPNPAGTDESPPPSSSESEFEPSSPSQFESAPPPSGAELVVVKLLHPEIDQERFLRLINFGIGRAMAGTASATTRKVDVPAFTAPERLDGAAAEPPADLFSWAATLVSAASGRSPFDGGSMAGTVNRITNGEPDLPDLGDLRDLVVAACQRIPPRVPRRPAGTSSSAPRTNPATRWTRGGRCRRA